MSNSYPAGTANKGKHLAFILLAALLSCSALGCKAHPEAEKNEDADKAIVTVNGTPLTVSDVNFLLRRDHGRELTPEVKKEAVEEAIRLELLYQKGLSLGLDRNAKYRHMVRDMERRLEFAKRSEIARLLYDADIASKVSVTDGDIRKYLDEHAVEMRTALHLMHLQFPDEAGAKQALRRLEDGLAFGDLAREKFPAVTVSEGKRAPWDLGFMEWKRIPPEWHDVAYGLKEGESAVVAGERNGVHLLTLVDRQENPDIDIESLRPAVADKLKNEKLRQTNESYIRELREEARIVKQEGWELVGK